MSTQHFTDAELCTSGIHSNISNIPTVEVLTNLQIVEMKLEELRSIISEYFGVETPVSIIYGYRGQALNAVCGGSLTSAHMEGSAADTRYGLHSIESIAAILMQHPTFMAGVDQLIIERNCLHLGMPIKAHDCIPRRELRHDQVVNGVRSYPLISVWRSAVADPNSSGGSK